MAASKEKVKRLKEDLGKADAAAKVTHQEEEAEAPQKDKAQGGAKVEMAEATLLQKELCLRRKIAKRLDENGKAIPEEKIEEFQQQADQISEQLEKRRRIDADTAAVDGKMRD